MKKYAWKYVVSMHKTWRNKPRIYMSLDILAPHQCLTNFSHFAHQNQPGASARTACFHLRSMTGKELTNINSYLIKYLQTTRVAFFPHISLRNYIKSHLDSPSFRGQLMAETVITGKATSKSLNSTSVRNCYWWIKKIRLPLRQNGKASKNRYSC